MSVAKNSPVDPKLQALVGRYVTDREFAKQIHLLAGKAEEMKKFLQDYQFDGIDQVAAYLAATPQTTVLADLRKHAYARRTSAELVGTVRPLFTP